MDAFLIYGASGYTGELIARQAAARGHLPWLAGRNGRTVAALARELDMPHRVFSLDDPATLEAGLAGARAVLHCAGPFSRTANAMADACLRAGAHYLDITGEVMVFEALAARDAEASAAGVMLLPGAGFDVVPSDCLAAHVKARLPSATELALGFQLRGGMSRGTLLTSFEGLPGGGLVRRGGRLTPVPAAWRTRVIDFGRGPTTAMTIPWGDLATAYRTTGIGDIQVYMAASAGLRTGARIGYRLRSLLGSPPVQRFLETRARRRPAGPSAEQRARGGAWLWGEASDPAGNRVVSRLRTPEAYTLTALTAVALVEKVLEGHAPPGFQTPASAYGKDFILGIDGVTREDDLQPLRDELT
jgi:short subunit dehydrogenase-like uncharacterized protein